MQPSCPLYSRAALLVGLVTPCPCVTPAATWPIVPGGLVELFTYRSPSPVWQASLAPFPWLVPAHAPGILLHDVDQVRDHMDNMAHPGHTLHGLPLEVGHMLSALDKVFPQKVISCLGEWHAGIHSVESSHG